MHMFKTGMSRVLRNVPDGAGGGGDGNQPGHQSGEHPASTLTAPWHGVEGTYKLGEGDKAEPWYNVISEEPIREYMKAKNYANPEEAARAAWAANKTLTESGRDGAVIMPKADADQKVWDEFYTKLGRPETPDKYDLKVADGVQVDERLMGFGKDLFHKMGLPPAKAQAALDEWNKFAGEANNQMVEQQRVANEADLAALTTQWGPDLDKNRAAGERVMKALELSPEYMEKLEANIGSAAVVELLAKIGRKSDEGSFKGGGEGGSGGDMNNPASLSPDQAQQRINENYANADFMTKFNDKTHPEHQATLAAMEQLFARAAIKK